MRSRYAMFSLLAVLVVVEVPFFIAWSMFFNRKHVEAPQKQNVIQIILPAEKSPSQVQMKRAEKTSIQRENGAFEGLDFQDLIVKIKGAFGKNLQVRIKRDKSSKNGHVTLDYTVLSFPKSIDVSRAKKNPKERPRKYAFVHYRYTDQLSKNTRAFLSLCAQAKIGGRKVVRPFVRDTRLSSDDTWSGLETYYDMKYLDSLLAAADYASLADKEEYIKECPFNSANHVSIHFIDNSKVAMGFTKAHFPLEEDFYNAILKNTTKKGWTQCSFLNETMKRASGTKQFCVNGDIIKDWKILERDVLRNVKCLNIYHWRGIDGVTYRLKFSEENLKFSSIDLTYALKPGQPVMKEVERYRREYLSDKYIAVYVRSEFMLRGTSMEYLRKCVDLVLEVLVALQSTTRISHVYVATDMSVYGSNWLALYQKHNNLDENTFKGIHDYVVSKSKGVAYVPPSDVIDRGVIALVDMALISQAQYLISAGTGTFQQWVAARFLEHHRNDKQQWTKITVCT